MDNLIRSIRQAETLVAVARAIFGPAVAALEAIGATLELHAPTGEPVVCATTLPGRCARLTRYMNDTHRRDRCLAAIRATWEAIASLDVDAHADDELVGPLVGEGALLGVLRFAIDRAPTQERRRRLDTICRHTSVRFAELGVSPVCAGARSVLTRRQREIVRLTARGFTTQQMAAVLAISPNTVKKHLKDVFARVAVHNRVDLALRARALASHGDQLAELRAEGITVVAAG